MIQKRDGSMAAFDANHLTEYLKHCLKDLNEENFNIELIVDKVSKGLYNGKYINSLFPSLPPRCPTFELMAAITLGFGEDLGIYG